MFEIARRPSFVRQMAFRQDSNDSEIAIRHGHLAAPNMIPDSPRPQKPNTENPLANVNNLSVDVPTSKDYGLSPTTNTAAKNQTVDNLVPGKSASDMTSSATSSSKNKKPQLTPK